MLKYFTFDELKCRSSNVVQLAPGFGEALDALREAYGKPMRVNSCCRTPEHNKVIGGHPRSMHLTENLYWKTGGTCAIDIHAPDGEDKALLVQTALAMGWSVGVASTFVHLDRRTQNAGLKQILYHYKS